MDEHQLASDTPLDEIARSIVLLRGHKVMQDASLAALYLTSTKRFNEQVRRNIMRFPPDFMFQVTPEEAEFLRSHFQAVSQFCGIMV